MDEQINKSALIDKLSSMKHTKYMIKKLLSQGSREVAGWEACIDELIIWCNKY